jgi:hypothetical protein
MPTTSEMYLVWADPESPWSPWVKPVLFAFMGQVASPFSPFMESHDLSWLPPNGPVAIVVDLRAEEGVILGMELARRGYRPVPLYNALPFPLEGDPATRTAVDVSSIVVALHAATKDLQLLQLANDAPPAFLVDASRRTSHFRLETGDFDNRSVCFVTDFPSAQLLRENRIESVIIIERGEQPDADLARVLAEWQAGGITLLRKDLTRPGGPEPLEIRRPRWWQMLWHALTVKLGLRHTPLGGFGAIVDPTAG